MNYHWNSVTDSAINVLLGMIGLFVGVYTATDILGWNNSLSVAGVVMGLMMFLFMAKREVWFMVVRRRMRKKGITLK